MVRSPPLSIRLLAFVLHNVLYFVTISSAIVLVFGSAFYPASIGLYLSFPYLAYTMLFARHELRRGAPWPWFSETFPLFSIMRSYLQLDFAPIPEEFLRSVEMKKKDEKKKNSQYVFALFPHGTSSDYRILMDGRIPGILPQIGGNYRVLAASVLFRIPLLRELALWTRCVDARRSVAHGILDNDDELSPPLSIMVVPGVLLFSMLSYSFFVLSLLLTQDRFSVDILMIIPIIALFIIINTVIGNNRWRG